MAGATEHRQGVIIKLLRNVFSIPNMALTIKIVCIAGDILEE